MFALLLAPAAAQMTLTVTATPVPLLFPRALGVAKNGAGPDRSDNFCGTPIQNALSTFEHSYQIHEAFLKTHCCA